ncbi:hypothetical protein MRB53_040264 [Persea americana]|nr:hypothetical protein MRB53_040264 [Persea americana]
MTSSMLHAVVSSSNIASTTPKDVQEKRHHNKHGKGFINPWDSYIERSGWQIGRMMIWRRITGKSKSPDTTPPTVPVIKPTFLPTRSTKTLRATWLGHACYYVEFPSGLRVLFDPVFTQRCSPFDSIGPKRYTEMPCDVDDIPIIDAVVISHNHYDHLSQPTIHKIAKKHPKVHFFVPLGNKSWFADEGLHNVTELDWWEERDLTLSSSQSTKPVAGEAESMHTSARTAFDKAHTLWASWSVVSGGKKLYFGGDTGYRTVPEVPDGEFDYDEKYSDLPVCPAFKEIGELRGPFDLGLIPIGAYDPRAIMSPIVNIFIDTQCKRALGIHWGTWVLTDEDVLEPPRVLKQALKWKNLDESTDEMSERVRLGKACGLN